MSQANIELARKVFKAFEERDMGAVERLCAPDIECDWSRRLLDPTVTRGYAGIKSFLEEVEGIFGEMSFEEEEVLDLGDRVLVVSTGRFRGRSSGIDVAARAANAWSFRDGKVARFCFYQSKEDALADLGVDPDQGSTERSASAT